MDQLLAGFEVDELQQPPIISGMTLDSRAAQPGDLFVALPGQRCHGLDYLDEAAERGCVAVLWESDDTTASSQLREHRDLPQVKMDQLGIHLGKLADRFYRQPSADLKMVAVTGTNGKSSCVHLMGQTVNQLGSSCGTIGTLGWGLTDQQSPASHTTPDAITVHEQLASIRDAGAAVAAMEVSSHALDQGRVNAVDFDAAVLTNLTRDHLDYHGDMRRYAQAKARLFSFPGLRFAILNQDDEFGCQLLGQIEGEVETISYGINEGLVNAREISLTDAGIQFELHSPWGVALVRTRLMGRFNIENLLAVIATLATLGWPLTDIVDALSQVEPVPGRMNLLGGQGLPLVVVDYAHTPDALRKSLEAVRAHCSGEIHCVFGCGGDRDRGKRALMAATAEELADQVIVTDDNPRYEDGDRIVADILAGFENPEAASVLRDRAAAIAQAVAGAGVGDVVLVAGKGHEDYQEIDGQRRHFDDHQAAVAALEDWQ
jgi:UDP-N-acetylmuramoyl-L-alanyl-D-glutamate--2,6-diaminopimelate ligase